MYSEPPFKFSYSAVMFNQTLFPRIKMGEIWSRLVEKRDGEKKKGVIL